MKAKKIWAIVLSVAMLATSGDFTLGAYAAEMADGLPAVEEFAADLSGGGAGDNLSAVGEAGDSLPATIEDTGASGDGNDSVTAPTNDGGDVIVDENDFFAVDAAGRLRIKADKPLESLKGTVVLPASAKRIPAGIFSNNANITGLTIPEDSLLAEIDAGAFEGSAIKTLTMPDAVTEIKEETFKNSKLQTLTFGPGSKLTAIGDEAFSGCGRLTGIVIPGLVTTVGNYAFNGCSTMTNVKLVNVESVGEAAFKNCTSLSVIGWSSKLKKIGNSAFFGCAIEKLEWDNTKLGINVTTWGTSVFENCSSLTTVRLNKEMSQVPAGMFKDCVKLTAVTISAECQIIQSEAFSGCKALKKIIIPEKVSRIKEDAFAGCLALTEVTIEQQGAGGESDILIDWDAFPQKGLTMKGYDGTVEDYAIEKKYTFKSLFTAYKITTDINDDSRGTVELSRTRARKGVVIEVKVTPAEGYRLKAYTFKYNDTNITKLKEESEGSQTFTFVMPDEEVKVTVDFESVNVSFGTLYADFDQIDQMTYDWNERKNVLCFDTTGLACRLVVKSHPQESRSPGAWMLTYTSKNSKVATVDSEGVIYARGKGKTTITATLKSDTTKEVSFTVAVLEEALIDGYSLDFDELDRADYTLEDIDGETFHVIQYTKAQLQKGEQSFKVRLLATSGADTTNLFVKSTWKAVNTDMVTLDKEVSEDNSNVVHVLEGVTGETAVTVTVTNNKTGKNRVVFYEESFIIRVIDVTPRLVPGTLTVNAQCTTGTEFELLSVYGYEVDPNSLTVVQAVKKKGVTSYEVTESAGYFSVRYSNDKYYMDITSSGRDYIENKTSKSFTKMFIEGDYTYFMNSGEKVTDTFRTPITSLVLTTKALKPTVKFSGRINLFYNSYAKAADKGQAVVSQSLKNLKVERYELLSEMNFIKEGSEPVDSLANNFVIDDMGVISRSDKPLTTDAKGKAVVKGYLKIKYEGYEPCYAKITIPTKTTKPGYKLSASKATVTVNGDGYRFGLNLIDKKKNVISLDRLSELSFDESASGTTMGLFEAMDIETARATDTIPLQIRRAQKGKAVINVQMDTWNEPMKFTFNLSITSKIPTVKAKPATLTLNNLCIGKAAETALTVNQADVTLINMDQREFVGKDILAADAAKISFSYENGVLSAWADDEIMAGSYKFRFTPGLQYSNGSSAVAKPITLTVKVINTNLSVALKPASVTLNNRYVGMETGVLKYTIKNMPESGAVNILSNNATITGVNVAATEVQDAFDISFAPNEQVINVRQINPARTGSFKYIVSGLKAETAGRTVDIQPFKITVKVINKVGKLTAKAKGSVNIGNSNSGIVYTLKMSNISSKIEKIVVRELDTTDDKNNGTELWNFKAEEVYKEDGSIGSVIIRASGNAQMDAKKTYKIRIGVILPGQSEEDAVWSGELKIKAKQVLPKIKTNVTSTTLYASVALNNPRRSQDILLTKTTQTDAEIKEVLLSASNSDEVKKAFKVSFNPETQKARITLIRPDMLRANTEYAVQLEATVQGQMKNTKGAPFTIKVTVVN